MYIQYMCTCSLLKSSGWTLTPNVWSSSTFRVSAILVERSSINYHAHACIYCTCVGVHVCALCLTGRGLCRAEAESSL